MLFIPLLACFLFAGCLTSGDTDETPLDTAVKVDTTLLDFKESADTMSFTITPDSDSTEWSISDTELPSWCGIKVDRRTSVAVATITVNRSNLPPGTYTTQITVKWKSGSHVVDISMTVPVVGKDTGTIIIDYPLPE